MNELNLKPHFDSYTRATSSSCTLVDLDLTNVYRKVLQGEVVGTGMSDHFAKKITFTSFLFVPPKCFEYGRGIPQTLWLISSLRQSVDEKCPAVGVFLE